MKWLAAILALLISVQVRAQTGTASAGGYADYLFDQSFTPSGQGSYDHLLQVRLNTKWYPSDELTGILELRSRAYYGSIVRNTPEFADQLKHDAGFGSLGVFLWKHDQTVGYSEIDRCYLNWNQEHLQVTLGRQRIAWGTNLVWNTIDVFNPLSILDFDYVERPAADAVRLQYYTGEVSKVEFAFKPGTVSSKRTIAGQWTANRWDYDFHFLGGWRGKAWFAGTAWAGDIEGGGFRGEVLASEIPGEMKTLAAGAVMVSAALSGDYTLPNSLYLHTEGLYNSEGVTTNAGSARPRTLALGLLSPARWSIYQEAGYDVSPLVRATVFAIVNPDDGSLVAVPSAAWSVITNLDCTFLAMFFHGAPLTEYGQLGTALFVRGKWSF